MNFVSTLFKQFPLVFKGEFARYFHRISLDMPLDINFNRYFLMVTDKLMFPEVFNENINVKIAALEDINDVCRISERSREVAENLITQGIKVFLAGEKGKPPCAILWSANGHCYIRGVGWEFDFGDRMSYIFWVMTLPEARGKGVYMKMLNEYVKYSHERGAEKFCGLVEFDNTNSFKVHSKLGYKTGIIISTWRIFSLKIVFQRDIINKKVSFKVFIKEPESATII